MPSRTRRGHQRQLGAGKSRGAEATQRQYTEANDDRDVRSDRRDHMGAPTLITEGVEATDTPQCRGILRAATSAGARRNKVGRDLAAHQQRMMADDGRGRPRRPLGPHRCAGVDRGGRGGTHELQPTADGAGGRTGSSAHGGSVWGELMLHSSSTMRRTMAGLAAQVVGSTTMRGRRQTKTRG